MSVRQNVRSAKCPFGKMSVRQNVRSAKCPFGKMSGHHSDDNASLDKNLYSFVIIKNLP
jgi:hypothetical protein